MDYSVWRVDSEDGTEVLWDGPMSADDAEKVRFCRQRDYDAEHEDDERRVRFEVRPSYDLSKE